VTRLAHQHAVITGGGTGIGAAIARALAAEGASLTLVGRRREPLEEVAATLPNALVAPADVTSREEVDRAFALARETHGPISILVANAGAAAGVPFGRVTETLWRDILAVNLDGVFHCCQSAFRDLVTARRGRIVTVASMAGLHGFAYAAPYIAAKHGAVGLTRALAAEYASTNLTANALCPGFVDSDMTAQSIANITSKTGRDAGEALAELARLNPSGRLIAPDEVAAAVLELVLSNRNGEAVEIA
jgi:NAD(P)-dependent dehydrogenase (short-subunit alcohol dehydrogenase family)